MIRPALSLDALGIATVHVKTWQHAYQGMMPAAYLQGLTVESRIQSWRTQIEDEVTTVIVDEEGAEIRGFLAGGKSRDRDQVGFSEIYAIYVDPVYQGKGIGRCLVAKFFESHSKPCSLWVLSCNEPSIGFYESEGFRADESTKSIAISDCVLEESRYILEK